MVLFEYSTQEYLCSGSLIGASTVLPRGQWSECGGITETLLIGLLIRNVEGERRGGACEYRCLLAFLLREVSNTNLSNGGYPVAGRGSLTKPKKTLGSVFCGTALTEEHTHKSTERVLESVRCEMRSVVIPNP